MDKVSLVTIEMTLNCYMLNRANYNESKEKQKKIN